MTKYILTAFIIWRLHLEVLSYIAKKIVPVREGFLGPVGWANFDGVHYLSIARNGYAQYEQAFFPFYPLLIRWFSPFATDSGVLVAMIISNTCFIGVLVLMWKLSSVLYRDLPKKARVARAKRTILAVLLFPTSFYFGAVYTESLFMLLILSAYYGLLQNSKLHYVFYASIASATRLIGAFLLVPVGLISYMVYLYRTTGDPLMFIHAQPAFGANRSGGDLVILPQVLWRYAKIFYTVSPGNYDFWIAILEVVALLFASIVLWRAYKSTIPKSWVYFSAAAILVPTLTGTLSSLPRYILAGFPIYFVLAGMSFSSRRIYYIASYILGAVLAMLFVQGHWIS